jgi:aminopeptidase N
MNDWHGKHPTPYDFFYSINNGSGKDLNWFWNRWFFGWQYPDLSIKKVERTANGTQITITNKGGLPVSVYLSIISKDGKKSIEKYTAEVWKDNNEKTFSVSVPYFSVSEIKLGNEFIPDKYDQNNLWKRK